MPSSRRSFGRRRKRPLPPFVFGSEAETGASATIVSLKFMMCVCILYSACIIIYICVCACMHACMHACMYDNI